MDELVLSWPQLKLLSIYGFWSKTTKNTRWRAALTVVGYLQVFLTILVIILEFVNVHALYAANEMDLNSLVITMNDILYAIQSASMQATVLVFENEFDLMIKELNELLEYSLVLMGPYSRQVFKQKVKICNAAFIASLSGLLLLSHWGIRPFLFRILYNDNVFVYHAWLPFDVDPWYVYFPVLGFQITHGIGWMCGQYMLASLFISISENILGHYDVLGKALSSLDYRDENASEQAKKYFKYHQKILKVCYKQRTAMRGAFLSHFLCVTAIICLNLYEITYVDIDLSRFLNVAEETVLELFGIAVYCYYCSLITSTSSEINDAAYFSEWVSATTTDRKSMSIFMASTRTPVTYGGGGFVMMSWDTFVNILKTAFSVYNFLGAIKTREQGHEAP